MSMETIKTECQAELNLVEDKVSFTTNIVENEED